MTLRYALFWVFLTVPGGLDYEHPTSGQRPSTGCRTDHSIAEGRCWVDLSGSVNADRERGISSRSRATASHPELFNFQQGRPAVRIL
jgi:hypothetical protein